METVRIGIVGYGAWGPNHVRCFSSIESCQIVRICDFNTERLNAAKRNFPDIGTTSDQQDILESDDVDAVIIATPLTTHYDLVKRALKAGKHVLCEKPLTHTSVQASELVQLAKSGRLVLMVGHVFMYNPGILHLKRDIETNKLGQIYTIDAVRTNLGPIRQDVGAIYDLASHDISIFNFLLESEPLEVSATGANFLYKEREDIAFLTLKYPNKIVCHMQVSWLNPRKVRQITVVGDRKMALWDDLKPLEPIRIYDKGVTAERPYATFGEFQLLLREGDIVIPKVAPFEPLLRQDQHFISSVLDDKTPLSDGLNGLAVVRVLEAAMESFKEEGRMVAVAAK